MANVIPMMTSVIVAFRGSGFSMLGTPFAIASLPVRPTDPEANARRMRSAPTGPASVTSPSVPNGSGGSAAGGTSPVARRKNP